MKEIQLIYNFIIFQIYLIAKWFILCNRSRVIIIILNILKGTEYAYVCGGTSGLFISYRNPKDYMIANLFNDVNIKI